MRKRTKKTRQEKEELTRKQDKRKRNKRTKKKRIGIKLKTIQEREKEKLYKKVNYIPE